MVGRGDITFGRNNLLCINVLRELIGDKRTTDLRMKAFALTPNKYRNSNDKVMEPKYKK